MKVLVSISEFDVRQSAELLNVGIITREPKEFELGDDIVESLKRKGFVVVSVDDDAKKHNKNKRSVPE